jgi:dephospho-CoA kinase
LAAQVDRLQQEALADDILYNQGSLKDLQTEIMRLHHHYLNEFRPTPQWR